jgi:hypothetical protein
MIFAAPFVLAALAALPPLYFILRAIPPSPRRQIFPPLSFLQNLPTAQSTPHRLPLWLLLLRLGATALLIIGFAGPSLTPLNRLTGTGTVLLVIDNGWASAAAWPELIGTARQIITTAGPNRDFAILTTARDPSNTAPQLRGDFDATGAGQILDALQPEPWPVDRPGATAALKSAPESTRIYLADGITDGPGFPGFISALRPSQIFRPASAPPLLGPAALGADSRLHLHALSNPLHATLLAKSADGGILGRFLFNASGDAAINLPPPIEDKIETLTLDGPPTAGGTLFLDASAHAIAAGLGSGSANAYSPFLGALYYLRHALPPTATVQSGSLNALLNSSTNILFLADTPLNSTEQSKLQHFMESGGILVRFAGPLTAANPDALTVAPLLPGNRQLGGTLSWTTPEPLAAFPPQSPFAGLTPDAGTTISQQTLADPTHLDPSTVWASLADGTPLILGKPIGRGYLVNILTTANASWSNLAFSGVFPAILKRLTALARGEPQNPKTALPLTQTMNGFGIMASPSTPNTLSPASAGPVILSPAHPPGLYGDGTTVFALNPGGHIPLPIPASFATSTPFGHAKQAQNLGPDLIALAILLLALDFILSLRLRGVPLHRAAIFLAVLSFYPPHADAQNAALQTQLAYVITNNLATDQSSADGLAYLSANVSAHSSVQLGAPAGIRPDHDDLAYYLLIYWPILPNTPPLSPAGCNALSTYMAHGGLLVIDMQGGDPGTAGSGAGFAPGAPNAYFRATACLNLPPLEPLTTDNVLAHSFYIIPSFPGRFTGAPVLIAQPPARDADDVTPVIVGQNDWAAAWARDATGIPEQTPIPGGDAQRLIADRFGVNLVIYALTGNYKTDQRGARTILDQLGP